MIFELAHERVISIDRQYELIGSVIEDATEEEYTLRGKYEFTVKSVNTDGESGECEMKWKSYNKIKIQSNLHNLHPDLIRILFRESSLHLRENGGDKDITIIGYTEMKKQRNELPCTFHASPSLQGKPWYDWAYVQYDIDSDEDNSNVEDDTSS